MPALELRLSGATSLAIAAYMLIVGRHPSH